MSNTVICPICGKTEFQEECNYGICEYCGCENDNSFEEGGANTLSLTEYNKRYKIYIYLNPKKRKGLIENYGRSFSGTLK